MRFTISHDFVSSYVENVIVTHARKARHFFKTPLIFTTDLLRFQLGRCLSSLDGCTIRQYYISLLHLQNRSECRCRHCIGLSCRRTANCVTSGSQHIRHFDTGTKRTISRVSSVGFVVVGRSNRRRIPGVYGL